ncbi:UPF0061 protein [Yarrowia sp. C11]|nr:UPF0061 protein [Yarrowia sp. C11]
MLTTLKNIKKTSTFTARMAPDALFPTLQSVKEAPEELLRKDRYLKAGNFTWVYPEQRPEYKLLAVSPPAVEEIGLEATEATSEYFKDIVMGKKYVEDPFPYAQAYAGWQFGEWAGQLGDGRALSLFETHNPVTGKRYELQLKGSGLTPYSRFADGKAVLRSSIREFLGSEYVNALGIPTTRALSLAELPGTTARRGRGKEPCAVVCRFAESWVRVGTFDLLRNRGDRPGVKLLSDYVVEEVFGGEDQLLNNDLTRDAIANSAISYKHNNRYVKLYREIVTRNAYMCALWQVFGYLNGVVNSDNTSVYGLTIDYGPYAFMDAFDPNYTPNHDDGLLRYSYKNVPTAVWWNMVRLGEDLAELLGVAEGTDLESLTKSEKNELLDTAEAVITSAGEEYKAVFLYTYKKFISKRYGLLEQRESDFDELMTPTLNMLEDSALDYHRFFRHLGDLPFFTGENAAKSEPADFAPDVEQFISPEKNINAIKTPSQTRTELAQFLADFKKRLAAENNTDDAARKARSREINPKFVLRSWVMQEVVEDAHKGDYDKLERVLNMALHPFQETWDEDWDDEEARFCGHVPKYCDSIQQTCSS